MFLGIETVSHYLRFCGSLKLTKKILIVFGANIGKRDVRIGPYIYIHNAFYKNNYSNLKICEDVYIGSNTVLDLWGEIILKNHVAIGMRSMIFTHSSFIGNYSMLMRTKIAPVIFEEHSGTNPGVTVLAGVTIGRNSYLTPGSVATENIPPYKIVRGNPAEVIKDLPEKLMDSFEKKYHQKIGWTNKF